MLRRSGNRLGLFRLQLILFRVGFLCDLQVQIHLRQFQAKVNLILFDAEIVQILILVRSVFAIFIVLERMLFHLGLAALGAWPLDGHLRWRRRRRMRLKEGANLLRGGQPAVDQLQEYCIHNIAIRSKFRGNAHLLQNKVRQPLTRFRPDLQE